MDVGSNSVLLTVASLEQGTLVPVLETSEVTALGEGLRSSGVLAPEAIARTLAAVSRAFARATAAGAESVLALATMAARVAGNRDLLLANARAQGTPIHVLSGAAESKLSLLSVVHDPQFASIDRIWVVDVGGQSTEIAKAARAPAESQGFSIFQHQSFSIGTLALVGGVLDEESPSSGALLLASSEIDAAIGPREGSHFDAEAVVVGATGTNLVSIRDGLSQWEPGLVHGERLEYEEIARSVGWLSVLSLGDRASLRGIEPGRERTIHAGALILERCLFKLCCESCLVSVRGWRHAVLQFGAPDA